MSATVFLARHGMHDEIGRVLSGRSEIALNEAGAVQAERMAARMAGAALDAIVTSPRRRARQTAEAVGKRAKIEVIVAPEWDEIDFGEWSGMSFEDLAGDPRWQFWNESRGRATTPGGESMLDVASRASGHLETRCKQGNVLIVSHGDVIRAIVAHYAGLDQDALLSFEVEPASITTLRFVAGIAAVDSVNERVP